jgi:hypothetical protein
MDQGRVGGMLSLAGSALVLLITLIYAVAGPDISTPLPYGVDLKAMFLGSAELLSAARTGTFLASLAGLIGLAGDFLLIGGGLLLAMRGTASVGRRLFWIWLTLSTLVFIIVDLLAGFVMLPVLLRADEATYLVARAIFDAAFVTGTAIFGLGLVAGWHAGEWPLRPRLFALLAGLVSLGTVLLHVFGITLPLLFGASVGLAAIAGILFAAIELKAEPGAGGDA